MITRSELLERMQEVEKDRKAFVEARTVIESRIKELEATSHCEFFSAWAGTQALMNVFIMVITRCEGLLEDMRANYNKMPEERSLRLVEATDE